MSFYSEVDVGKAIRYLRKEKNMSQIDLRKSTGLETSYISKLENGIIKNPKIMMIVKIAKGFEIKPSELMSIAENCNPLKIKGERK